jgi:hypothetical protein
MLGSMIELLEVVTEDEVLKDRTEKTAPFIRRFFSDAGTNPVRAFNDRAKNCGGYIFFDDAGRYFMLVTVQINPTQEDADRWKRQFTDLEWFTGNAADVMGEIGKAE